jgi:hypothetical protein
MLRRSRAAIGQTTERRIDFESLARELERSGKQDAALSPKEIARHWAAVHRYASALATEADERADRRV